MAIVFLIPIILITSCGKEELTVLDVPFEDLQSSYYVLHDVTVEIPAERYTDLVVSRTDDQLVLADDPIFAELVNGSILISDPQTDKEDFILRRVVSAVNSGGQITLSTEAATHIDAYEEFYLNTRYESIIGLRSSNDFAVVDNQKVDQMFANVGDPGQSAFSLSPVYEFDGQINFEAIHPHTAYRYFGPCMGSISCFNNINKEDKNGNGYYDVVDAFFNNQLVADNTKNGLYTISFDNAGIKKIGIKYGTSLSTMGAVELDPMETPAQIRSKIIAATKQSKKNQPKSGLNIFYTPTPLTFWGGFTVTIPAAPILDFEMESSMAAELVAVFPERIDMQMGHLNWNSTVPDVDMDFKFTQNGTSVSPTKIFENASVNVYAGIDGSATLKFGVAIGAAITAGEGNKAGLSMGALMEFSNYYTLSGLIGVKATDVLNSQSGGSLTFEGSVCFDMGIDYDFSVFVDANLGPFIGDFFDVKLTAPKGQLGLSKFSMMSLLMPYTPDKGLCLDVTPCNNSVAQTLNIGLNDQDNYRIEFNISNTELKNELYRLIVKSGGETINLNGPYAYGEDHIEDLMGDNEKIRAGLLDGTIQVEVFDINVMCTASFAASEVGFVVSCDQSIYETSTISSGGVFDITNVAGDVITYFTKEQAQEYCANLVSATVPKDVLIDLLRDLPCVVPTGFVLPDNEGNRIVDSNKAFIWIPEEPNGHNLLIIEFIYKPGSDDERKFTTARASESVYAPLICM